MGKRIKSLVLSDELLDEYLKFKDNSEYDKDIIEKLLHYYKPVYITNISQYERINHEIKPDLKKALSSNRLTNQSLEELASKTKYKIILSANRSDFPYVNINNDNIENNFTGTFLRSEPRLKAIEHIKSLCNDAKKSILVYDKYFYNKEDNADMLIKLLPLKKIEITYQRNSFSEQQINKLKSKCADWTFKDNNFTDNHDRYLIIDDNVEIILTSGFSYLNDFTKEITYIVRLIDGHQFM